MADEMEYAVRRVSDGRYLWDDDLDGVYQSWQKDPENAHGSTPRPKRSIWPYWRRGRRER